MPPSPSAPAIVRLLRYARGYRRRIMAATVCSVVNKLFDIAPEILIGVAIDVVVNQEASFLAGAGIVDPIHQLALLGVLTFLIWGGESLFEYLYMVLWRNLAQRLQHDLRLDAYAHVQNLDMAYFEDRSTGNLVAILNDDINQLERFLNGGANSIIQVVTTVIAVGGVFFLLSPLIALLAFTPVPVIILGAFFFQRRAQPLYTEVRERVGVLASRLSNNLSGIATIKSFTAETLELERLRADSNAYCQANARAIAVSSAFIPIIRMAILTGFLFTFVVGGVMALNGTLNVGAYGLLVFLTQRLLWPLTGLAETVDLYERAMASTRRILNLLAEPISIRNHETPQPLPWVKGRVVFDAVDFAYGDGIPVLKNVSFTVEPGQTVAFVGQTGSGKSTVMKLLLRFYSPSAGSISLDGHPLASIDLTDLRGRIGLVSQDVFLFHGSVRENIAYGNVAASDDDVTAAAKAAEAHGFIERLAKGYDTIIGERGQKLSGGQRQRLSIARAVLKNPPVLILDEATSAIDNETEAAIQRSLKTIAVGRTVIMVAHRLSTIVHADRIFVLDAGEIREAGTHDELVRRGGIYANLWRVQTGDAAA